MKTNYKLTLPILALAATSALYSCSDKDSWYENGLPDPDKELISFTSNGGETVTRATLAGTRAGFTAQTKIEMKIKAEDIRTGSDHLADRFSHTYASAGVEVSSTDDHTSILNTIDGGKHSDVTMSSQYYRYWDDAFGRNSKLSIYAVCVPNKSSDAILPNNLLTDGTTQVSTDNPNWKTTDAGNDVDWSLITTPEGGTATTAQTATNFLEEKDLCYSNNISTGGTNGVYRQAYATGNGWTTSLSDGPMIWKEQSSGSTVGKFDQGNLIFKHALCKVTIVLTEGEGFVSANNDYNFKTDTDVELLNFPVKGKLNVATGSWTIADGDKQTITRLNGSSKATNSESKRYWTVSGLTLPEKDLKDDNSNALHFIIDNNDYYVTCDQIATAIRTYYTSGAGATSSNASTLQNFTKMTQSQHYFINITVSKTKIDNITAQLIAWEEVQSAEIKPTNAYVNLNLEDSKGTAQTIDIFNLYRKASTKPALSNSTTDYINDYNSFKDYEWKTGYETTAATKSYANSKWSTNWNWPDNLTYYHLRAIGYTEATSGFTTSFSTDATNGDFFNITSGGISTDGTQYKDYIWGAPFTKLATDAKFEYSTTKGFDKTVKDASDNVISSQIYHAIGATNDAISMTLFHMTSQLFVDVTTTTGDDKVILQTSDATQQKTKVEILSFYKDGTVRMGNGLVEPSTTNQTVAPTENQEITQGTYTAGDASNAAKFEFSYGVVPQALSGSYTLSGGTATNYTVGLRITTPDNNQYVIRDISNVYATTVNDNNLKNPYSKGTGDNANNYLINRWYPGYKYYYTVTLKKTGIASITAQLVDWETVKGDLGNITLEGTN